VEGEGRGRGRGYSRNRNSKHIAFSFNCRANVALEVLGMAMLEFCPAVVGGQGRQERSTRSTIRWYTRANRSGLLL
jgi:hypothetical protein